MSWKIDEETTVQPGNLVYYIHVINIIMEQFMSTRLNITISDDLNNEIDKAAAESETNKSEIFRKALTLYLAMYEGRKKGRKVGLVDPDTQKLETEIIGL